MNHPPILAVLSFVVAASAPAAEPIEPVTIDTFIRAETDLYFERIIGERGIGRLGGARDVTPIDKQDVVRMNRDTIYFSGVFDLDAAPVAIVLPDAGRRFISLQVINQDHYTIAVSYEPGTYTFDRDTIGTRYVFALIRVLADSRAPSDIKAAGKILDSVQVRQAQSGSWERPNWDQESQSKIRDALERLGAVRGVSRREMFGAKDEVDPVLHLIGTATGWGGNPRSAAVYLGNFPRRNDDETAYVLRVRDVPVDGFWSVSVYNAKGYFEKNAREAYSISNLTAKLDADGAITIHFGGDPEKPNFIPITPGWNYVVRLYRPRREILDGTWTFPEARPVE